MAILASIVLTPIFSVASVFNLFAFPFLAEELKTEGITFSKFILMLSAGLGAAAGAHKVFTSVSSNNALHATRENARA
jgi:hypothetical protein